MSMFKFRMIIDSYKLEDRKLKALKMYLNREKICFKMEGVVV